MTERLHTVEFTSQARKQLAKLERTVQERVLKAAVLLATQPRPPVARRLTSASELWRVQIGQHRLIYSIDDGNRVVVVARIGHRSAVYRRLDEL